MCARDWAYMFFGYTKTVCSIKYSRPTPLLHASLECVFRSQIFLRVTPWKAAWNPCGFPAAPGGCWARVHLSGPGKQGCGTVPSIRSLCTGWGVLLGPVPGISGSRGGMFLCFWVHTDADPRGWTNTFLAAATASVRPFSGPQKCLCLGQRRGRGRRCRAPTCPMPTLCPVCVSQLTHATDAARATAGPLAAREKAPQGQDRGAVTLPLWECGSKDTEKVRAGPGT